MIELAEQQVQALERPESTPNEEYDDSPWAREELQALAWQRVKHEQWDEYDECNAGAARMRNREASVD